VLRHTFCHLPKVGPRLEQRVWEAGVRTWDDVLEGGAWPLRSPNESEARRLIEESAVRLEAGDAEYFAAKLPAREQWRLFGSFDDRLAYLDIETTGTAWPEDQITTIALYDGRKISCFVQGQNLEHFADAIAESKVLVSYNGKSFDGPFIEKSLGIRLPRAHIDLRYVLHSLGFGGGLKNCERQLGLARDDLEGIDGYFAVLLWRDYCRSRERGALDTLLAYNIADTVNLETLLVRACNLKLKEWSLDMKPLSERPAPPNPFNPHMPTVQRLLGQRSYFS
jgi:uncharacterized protein